MHRISKMALAVLVVAAAAGAALGQQRVYVPKEGFPLMLPGLLIFLSTDEEASEVQVTRRVQFKEELAEEYSDLDLKEGDVIVIADGQPLTSIDDFKKIYEEAEVGAEISLGVRRENEVMVLSFPKPDPSSLPRMRMQRGAGEGLQSEGGPVMIRKEAPKKEKKKEQKPPL
ncbi:MAG: hypothetical protein V3T83_00070 [Acidobacteriota bacterium]